MSLALRPGEIVGIVGRSGSGKSTLARILAGLEAPDSGTVTLQGQTTRRRLRPGYVMPVFQDPVASLDRRWPLWRTLAEPVRARGGTLTRAAAERALADVGLHLDLDRRPGSLSVGQAQRVAIARALLAEPALLVADEPTASLDVATTAAVTDRLRTLADRGTAILIVSHDRARLGGYADHVRTMAAGRLT
ncbi:ABC transporter ATP-binding protein [Pseudonocardia xishanensis]|uniref:ABC transporter domain-containing protein n=1 Tax=Pseudonocardia xishanensis TaxID=630995 RepID=A0ABP8RUZ4_9PSEU